MKMKMKAVRLWMKSRTPENRMNYTLKRKEIDRIKRNEKAKAWSKVGRDLKEDHYGTKKLLFSMAKYYRGKNKEISYAIKDKEEKLLFEPGEIVERWREYFEDLLNSERAICDGGEWDREYQLIEDSEEDWNITEQELRTAIKAMKNGKATGEDGIPVELIKSAGRAAETRLLDLFNTVFSTERVPRDWQCGVVCPIFKKGERTECKNHRGVMLLSHTGKIYNRIIEKSL